MSKCQPNVVVLLPTYRHCRSEEAGDWRRGLHVVRVCGWDQFHPAIMVRL